jgi:5'-nucleotidase
MTKDRMILLTNDDGIQSPGLWAAAETLSRLGFVHVVAPRDQYSGAGRSMPSISDGLIRPRQVTVNEKCWTVYSVGGSPAQAVLHALLEILPGLPDLVVSGINYGENVGSGVTVSGTVGAALEAAAHGLPALAVSLETEPIHHLSYSTDVDFSAAAHFTGIFAQRLLERRMPPDVDVLKIDVPCDAHPDTPWELTRVARHRYFEALRPRRTSWDQPETLGYRRFEDAALFPRGTDAYTLQVHRKVSVTPLSLDLTSRVTWEELEKLLRP